VSIIDGLWILRARTEDSGGIRYETVVTTVVTGIAVASYYLTVILFCTPQYPEYLKKELPKTTENKK
jgi:hypothetical protein